MSDINLTIGVEATEVNKALGEINQKLEGLRGGFKGSGVEINKEMQRTASAIERLKLPLMEAKRALREEQQELSRLKTKVEETGISVRKLAKSQDVLNKEQLEAVTNYRSQIEVVNKAKSSYNEQANVIEKLRQRLAGLGIVQKQVAGGTGGLTAGLTKLYGVANQVAGVFGFGLGLYGFVRLIRGAARTIVEFEKAQKELAAVSNATAREMEQLSSQAILIGSSTKYGAAGVSVLQVQLARMGFTIGQIGDMAKGITNLATAAGEDLPKAAETVAFVLRAYNLRATETTRVTDTMAYSFTQSALDLEKFRQSMKYIAPIANQANFSLEDTSAILAQLANAGISGSLAGTSLRNVISQLADSNSELNKRVGMTVNGFDDFVVALRTLKDQGAGLGEVFQVMDRRAASAFTIMLEGIDTIEAMRKSMDDAAGAAERMAKVQKDSIAYQTKLAKAAWEGFIVSLDKGDALMSQMAKSTLKLWSEGIGNIAKSLNLQSKRIKEDIEQIEAYSKVIQDSNANYNSRILLFRELQQLYPEYLGNLREEEIGTNKAAVSLERLMREQEIRAAYEAASEELEKYGDLVKRTERDMQTYVKASENGVYRLVDGWKILGVQLRSIRWTGDGEIDRLENMIEAYSAAERRARIQQENLRRQALSPAEFAQESANVDAFTQANITEFTKLMNGYKEQGVGAMEAIDEASKDVMSSFNKQLGENNKFIETNTASLEAMYSAKANGETFDQTAITHLEEEVKNRKTANEEILLIIAALNAYFGVVRDGTREEIQLKSDLLKLEQRLAELRATYAENGIEQERKLIEIRRKYALRLAEIEEDPKKRNLLRLIAEEQYKVDLQRLNQQILKDDNAKNAELRKNAEELNKLMRRLSDERANFELSAIDRRNYQERQRLEVESQEITSQRIIEDIYNRAEEEKQILYDKLQEELALIGGNNIEKARLEQEYQDKKDAIGKAADQEAIVATEESFAKDRELYRKQLNERIAIENEILDERLAIFDAQQEQEKILFDSKRQNEVAIRNFEKQQAIARLEELKVLAEARKAVLEQELTDLGDKDPFQTAELERQLEGLQRTIDTLDLQIEFEPFDKEAWDEMLSAIKNLGKEVGDTLKQITKDREDAAKRERDILDGRIAEAQRAVDTELKLYEQGFASNVETKRKELAELEKLRANALKAEEKAIAQRRAMDAVLQATNLITAVSQIIRSQSLAGPVGIALAAGGIAAMFALFNNAKKLSSQTTKYEKGGSFTLKGRSHASGGVLLAPGHEAQGGEQVSVFNRSATKRFGSQIRQFTDDINKGKNPLQNINVFADSKDLKAMRKIMEREQVEYHDSYKVIRRGNVTTICRN